MTPTWSRACFALAALLGGLALVNPAAAQPPPGFSPLDTTKPAESKQNPNLRGHPVPPTATPVEKLPVDKIKLPAGFKAEIWSSGHPARAPWSWATRAPCSWARG